MRESSLYRSIARATGEPLSVIRRMGFSVQPRPCGRYVPRGASRRTSNSRKPKVGRAD
jgi:hypothetical protein